MPGSGGETSEERNPSLESGYLGRKKLEELGESLRSDESNYSMETRFEIYPQNSGTLEGLE